MYDNNQQEFMRSRRKEVLHKVIKLVEELDKKNMLSPKDIEIAFLNIGFEIHEKPKFEITDNLIKHVYFFACNMKNVEQNGYLKFVGEGSYLNSLNENAYLYSNRITNQFSFEVKKIRKDIFGQIEPPFKSKDEAISWIKNTVKNEPKYHTLQVVVDNKTADYVHKSIIPPADPITPEEPISINIVGVKKFERASIAFEGPNKNINSLPISSLGDAAWSTSLAKLQARAESLSKKTGWQEAQAVMHILTGVTPLLETRIMLHDKYFKTDESLNNWINLKYITVTFFGYHIRREELIRLHSKIREMLGMKNKKNIEKEYEQIVEHVNMHAPKIKSDNNVDFWNALAKSWAKSTSSNSTSGDSFRRRYKRACERLNTRPIRFKSKRS